MELHGSVTIVKTIGDSVWVVNANPSDLKLLGLPKIRTGNRSLVALGRHSVSGGGKILSFNMKEAVLMNLSSGQDCLFVALSDDASDDASEVDTESELRDYFMDEQKSSSSKTTNFRSGDADFLAACEEENLPEDIVSLGRVFLKQVGEFSSDKLQEGLHRKWVTYPKNFLAMTIQNRNMQFCVHVKRSLVLDGLADILDIRDDRPGYVRFWLQERSQLDAAVKAARGSFGV